MTFLSPDFLENFRGRSPDWGPVGEVVYKRTYERSGEGWNNTVRRVVELCYQLQADNVQNFDMAKARRSAEEMYTLIWDMKFLPPGRSLDCGEYSLVQAKGGQVLYNCGFTSTASDILEAATWAMDHLALGVGVGFDTLGAGRRIPTPGTAVDHYMVPDSREGWVEAIRKQLTHKLHGGPRVIFNLTKIRPEGTPLKTLGGTASGPEPLRVLLEYIEKELFLDKFVTEQDIVDLFCAIGRCIVSGNKRRSALIALGSSESFQTLKDPGKHPEFGNRAGAWNHPVRWAANLSRSCASTDDLSRTAELIQNGVEIGLWFQDNCQTQGRIGDYSRSDYKASGTNPCSEQTLEDKELCNLVEVFPSRHSSYLELQRTLKFAYLYAKTMTLAPGISGPVLDNRRIGCSMTGIVGAIERHGYNTFINSWLPRGYEYLRSLDTCYSEWMKIPQSLKITSVKPSGTVSKLPGVSPGVHWPHAPYYWQVIRFSKTSPYLGPLRDAGYQVLETSEPNTVAVYFPVKEKVKRTKREVSLREQMELVAQIQEQWSDNQVSATFSFSEEDNVETALTQYARRLKSATFLKRSNKMFQHMPYQAISQEVYEIISERIKPVVWNSSTREVSDKFCDSDKCEV